MRIIKPQEPRSCISGDGVYEVLTTIEQSTDLISELQRWLSTDFTLLVRIILDCTETLAYDPNRYYEYFGR